MVSSASEPTDSAGSRSKIGTNAAVAFGRIHTPPSAVPTNTRPLAVGSAISAVTRPVTPASALPRATPPKVGISLSRGDGPSAFHARGTAPADESRAALTAESRSCIRICAIALRYASGGIPKFNPRRLRKKASRAARSRACNDPGALRFSRADRGVAGAGEDRIIVRAKASSRPPLAARSHSEKVLDKAKTPLQPASSSHSTLIIYTNEVFSEYTVDYLLSIARAYMSDAWSTLGSTGRCRCTRKGPSARRRLVGYGGQAEAIRKPIFGK